MQTHSLRDLVVYFLKLGATGFGGPVALVNYMHRDLVEKHAWFTEAEYKEGMALSQLAPGPLATQLCIYLGFIHHGVWGATLVGVAFVIPSFVMVVGIGMAYIAFGGLPWMQAIFYGVSAAVVGIIINSIWKLTTKSVSKIEPTIIRKHWLLWLLYFLAAVITVLTKREELWVFVLAGVAYMMVKAPPKRPAAAASLLLFLPLLLFTEFQPELLAQIAWFFTKAGAFVFGSGLAIVPFLHEVVSTHHWLNEQQFVDAVAVAMITPGPVVITVGFIGFLVAGFAGAVVAACATFLPCYLITVLLAPHFKKIAGNQSIQAFVDGITAAVMGALAGAVIIIATNTLVDVPTVAIALVSLLAIVLVKKLQEPHIIAIAAVVGLLLKL